MLFFDDLLTGNALLKHSDSWLFDDGLILEEQNKINTPPPRKMLSAFPVHLDNVGFPIPLFYCNLFSYMENIN